MTAEEFYEAFKDALNFVGCGWQRKDNAQICVQNDNFCVLYAGRTAAIQVPEAESGEQA